MYALGLSVDPNDEVFSIASNICALTVRRQKRAGFAKKMRWALYDEKQLSKTIEDITGLVNDLVELFPAAKAAQHHLYVGELGEIVDARNDEQGLVKLQTVWVDLDETMSSIAGNSLNTLHSHSYINISATDKSRVMNGDQISKETFAAGNGHSYQDISASGTAGILNGNSFGGQSIWDD